MWLRSTLHPMTFASLSQGLRSDTAPVPFLGLIYRDYFPAFNNTYTATPPSLRYGGQSAPARNKNCTPTAKTTPWLSASLDSYTAKVSRSVNGWTTATANYSYHRAVSTNLEQIMNWPPAVTYCLST